MQVNGVQAAARYQIAAAKTSSQADFQASLDVAKQNLIGASIASSAASSSESPVEKVLTTHKTAGEELAEYQSKSVAQHLRDAILKEMGLTEDDLDAMTPEKRAAVEETIAKKIQERLLAQSDSAPELSGPPILSLLTQGLAAIEQLSSSRASSVF